MRPTSVRPSSIRLGIDLGGTKTEIMALTTNGAVALRQRIVTPRITTR